MFLLKLPFRVAALPVVLALALVQFITALVTGLSSIVTNLIGTLGISTAACIWMFHLGTDADAYRMLPWVSSSSCCLIRRNGSSAKPLMPAPG